MDIEQVDAICMSLSGVKRGDQSTPGVRCWTVDGRVFATITNGSDRVSLRCADEKVAQILVDHGRAGMLPELPHGCWVALNLSVADFELNCRIIESYEMVRANCA